MVTVNLDEMESMIALPFHHSKAYTIHELQKDQKKIFAKIEDACNRELGGKVKMDLMRSINEKGEVCAQQGVIVGCSGGMYENIVEAAAIIKGKSVGNGYFDLSVYPSSSPIGLAITKDGTAAELMEAGAVIKPAFCGPCFGAGDTPANNTLSIRHATRNFANREGSKPASGQVSAVALMDARSIAATAINGGVLTAATDIEYTVPPREYKFERGIYDKRCYFGFGKADPSVELRFGPNIADWPKMPKMEKDLLFKLCAVIDDPVEIARAFSKAHGCTVLLKNAVSIIASPDGRLRYNSSGNPGLAKGGSGDCLSGILTALLAQGLSPFDAASSGAYLLGSAADKAFLLLEERLLTASDTAYALESLFELK